MREIQIKKYRYADRTGSLKAEAVGEVKSEKYFPIFDGGQIFKPLTKSKPFSTPLFAYAEVFWSNVINEYFVSVPQYQLAFCTGYEAETKKYYDYGTVVPRIDEDQEHLVNLLEFFRKYPDEKADIDHYINYCQMFYDYTAILETDFFLENERIAKQLVMQILISILQGDQNFHYENVAFLCDEKDKIKSMAPMIDHEFSAYFMFPDDLAQHSYWFDKLLQSLTGRTPRPNEFSCISDPAERKLMEKSARCIHGNLLYIKEHYPEVTAVFLEKLGVLERDLNHAEEQFYVRAASGYPDFANSCAFYIGKARYKDQDEEQAKRYEEQYGNRGETIDFDRLNIRLILELRQVLYQMKKILC